MSARTVRAAGTIVVRDTVDGPLVCIVRRERRQDWSLPKGKLEPGETFPAAAIRETFEETGHQVVLGPPLTTQSYEALGRPKIVRYWRAAEVASHPWSPDGEVAEVAWVTPHQAREQLTYPRDADLVDEALALPGPTWPLVVLRHGQAEKRSDWARRYNSGQPPEASRPLTAVGRAQAADLVSVLRSFGVARVVSSDAERCIRTVAPYATAIGASITAEHELSEEGHRLDPQSTRVRSAGWAQVPESIVICTHRPVLPDVLESLTDALGVTGLPHNLAPGSAIVVHRAVVGGQVRVVAIEELNAVR